MPALARVSDAATTLDVPAAVLYLPDGYLEEVEKQIRHVVLPQLQQLTPRDSGELANSYRLRPLTMGTAADPVFEIAYASYGRWAHFKQPVAVNGRQASTVPELIHAVMQTRSREVYTGALRSYGDRLGLDTGEFDLSSEIVRYVVRQVTHTVRVRAQQVLSTKIGRAIGREIAAHLRRQNFAALREFTGRLYRPVRSLRADAGEEIGLFVGEGVGWELHRQNVGDRRAFFNQLRGRPGQEQPVDIEDRGERYEQRRSRYLRP